MKELSLKEIVSFINGKINNKIDNNSQKIFIKSISTDTREDLKDKLYIALEGDKFDGHDFVNQAIEKGATAVIVHKDLDVEFDNIIKVENTKKALMDIAAYYRSLFNIKVIGVTGSVGKTTTKDIVALALSKKYKVLKTSENLNNEIGVSKTILALEDKYDIVVVEMGMSNFGEISELSNIIKPDIGIITNIGVSHIETLGNRENILKAKLEILDGMKSGSILILNKDDNLLSSYNNSDYNIKYYSLSDNNADVFVEDINTSLQGTNFNILDGLLKRRTTIPCFGEHNIYSVLIAYIIGKELKVDVDEMIDSFASYLPSGMRQKTVYFKGMTIVEDCYNASPDSMKAAIKTLNNIDVDGQKIMVISDMLELGNIAEKEHYNIGKRISKSKIDKVYCFGNLSKQYILGAIDNGMDRKKLKIFDDKLELFSKLKDDLKAGSIIWFKASRGMKLEEVIEKIYKDEE